MSLRFFDFEIFFSLRRILAGWYVTVFEIRELYSFMRSNTAHIDLCCDSICQSYIYTYMCACVCGITLRVQFHPDEPTRLSGRAYNVIMGNRNAFMECGYP